MSRPVVTLGMPVYNGSDYVTEAIEAVLAQTFGDFELLIADNASTDGTPDICHAIAGGDPRVRILGSTENRGLAWNWNRLLPEARGRYFRWTCHDDRVRPELLERCVTVMDASPAIGCYPGTIDVDEIGRVIGPYEGDLDLRDSSPVARFQHLVRGLTRCNMLYALFRTDILRSIGPLGAFPHADQALLARAALRGEIWKIPGALFERRIHGGMSLLASDGPASLARLYDTASTGRYFFPQTRLYGEYARAASTRDLSAGERAECLAILAVGWRFYRAMGGEVKLAAKQWAGLSRSTAAAVPTALSP